MEDELQHGKHPVPREDKHQDGKMAQEPSTPMMEVEPPMAAETAHPHGNQAQRLQPTAHWEIPGDPRHPPTNLNSTTTTTGVSHHTTPRPQELIWHLPLVLTMLPLPAHTPPLHPQDTVRPRLLNTLLPRRLDIQPPLRLVTRLPLRLLILRLLRKLITTMDRGIRSDSVLKNLHNLRESMIGENGLGSIARFIIEIGNKTALLPDLDFHKVFDYVNLLDFLRYLCSSIELDLNIVILAMFNRAMHSKILQYLYTNNPLSPFSPPTNSHPSPTPSN